MWRDRATWQPVLGRTLPLRSWIIANILAGARFVCFIQVSESALPLGAGMATERCPTVQLDLPFLHHFECRAHLFFKVDMYAVESHRFAESWIFTATNDSVVRKANSFYGTYLNSEIVS